MAIPTSACGFFFDYIRKFPTIDSTTKDLNLVQFLEAVKSLVILVERIGKVFKPVKYDMQGNIDKVEKLLNYDETTCLLELIRTEIGKNRKKAAEAVLWLNRALLFFEIIFDEIIVHIRSHKVDVTMKNIFTNAYEHSVKKYHGWVTQQLFVFICRMSPTLPQVLISLEVNNEIEEFERILSIFSESLHSVRVTLDDFYENTSFD